MIHIDFSNYPFKQELYFKPPTSIMSCGNINIQNEYYNSSLLFNDLTFFTIIPTNQTDEYYLT